MLGNPMNIPIIIMIDNIIKFKYVFMNFSKKSTSAKLSEESSAL